MQIKRNLYCITDKNNKPDYRFLFESVSDAQKKISSIKNSIQGETLFVSKNKRDFFIDGINKKLLDATKTYSVKRGCWTGLKVNKLNMLDTIEPKTFFKDVVQAEEYQFSFSKQHENAVTFQNPSFDVPSIPNPFLSLNWENSFLHTKPFALTVALLVMTVIATVFGINYRSSNAIAKETMDVQTKNAQKLMAMQKEIADKKEAALAQQASDQFDQDLNKLVLETLKNFENLKQEDYQNEINKLLAGSPMEKMSPYIAQQDRTVAAFLIGIAKKESNLGRRVPVLNGQDCYNYWGYRGIRARMGSGGHTCFDSLEDAVATVSSRLQELIASDIDTPQEMVIWKCGSACSQDSQAGKWIRDVNLFYSKLKSEEEVLPENPNS